MSSLLVWWLMCHLIMFRLPTSTNYLLWGYDMATYNFDDYPISKYLRDIKSQEVRPRFRLSLLYPDESFKEDITPYVMKNSGTLSVNYQQGTRRSLTFTLDNADGRFTPNGHSGIMWLNTKFKLELGYENNNGDEIFLSAGIFCMLNPASQRQGATRIIQVQAQDKWCLLDGTLGGTLDSEYLIKADMPIRNIFQDTLLQDNGNGYPIDLTTIIFDTKLKDSITQHDISESPGGNYANILIQLANMISCDVYYDVNGHLTVRSGIVDISHVNKPILWKYSDDEFELLEEGVNYDFTSVKNVVTVVGSNSNGDKIYIQTASNVNPQSPTRVALIGRKQAYIEDSNIFSDDLALDRAEYELNKMSILANTVNITSSYMIHLDVNSVVSLTDSHFGFKDEKFIIQGLNIPISDSSTISVDVAAVASLPYYPS